MQTECDGKKLYCGTTALGAFVLGSQLLVFSIGDCQAVLCTNGKAVRYCLTCYIVLLCIIFVESARIFFECRVNSQLLGCTLWL